MHKIQFPLNPIFCRPVISLYTVNALIDSGSVWLIIDSTEEAIKQQFGGKKTGIKEKIQGISRQEVAGEIYLLSHFCMGEMVFRNFPAVVAPIADPNIGIIIGSSLYSRGTKYTIDTENSVIIFEYPEIFFLSGKPCIKRNGEWKYLDVKDDKLVALTAN